LSVEELSGSIDLPTIDMEDCMPPAWIDDDKFRLLLLNTCLFVQNKCKDVTITRVTVNGLAGYSGVGVYSLKYFADNSEVIQYVLRLHEEEEQARLEYNTIEKISRTGFDVFAYVPVGEPYIAHGALLYTHASRQTYDDLKHLHVFLGDLVKDSNTFVEVRLRKLCHGIRTLIKALSSIEKPGYITTLDYYKSNTLNFPPRNIIDLRNMTYKIADGVIHIDSESGRGDTSANDGPYNIVDSVEYQVNAQEIDYYRNGQLHRILLSKREDYRTLLARSGISVLYGGTSPYIDFASYCRDSLRIEVTCPEPETVFESFCENHSKEPLCRGYCHNDLHCKNILVSDSNIKFVDIGDAGRNIACRDFSRLELSIMSMLCQQGSVTANDCLTALKYRDGGIDQGNISMQAEKLGNILKIVKESMFDEFVYKPSVIDQRLASFIEVYEQLNYSMSSAMRLPEGFGPIVDYYYTKFDDITKATI
jgi:hypothetical protein